MLLHAAEVRVFASFPLILFRFPPFTQESNIFSSLAGEDKRKAAVWGRQLVGLTRSLSGRKLGLLITFCKEDSLSDLKITL